MMYTVYTLSLLAIKLLKHVIVPLQWYIQYICD